MKYTARLIGFLCGYLITIQVCAQVTPTYTEAKIEIDGQFSEPQWQSAEIMDNFSVVRPQTLGKPKYTTRVRVLYSQQGLYFAISNYQPVNTFTERLSARDSEVERDSVQLVLDTSGSGLYGYVFNVGLGGSLMDGTVLPEREFSYEWNAPWQAKTRKHDNRWEAEVFIPWSSLKLPKATHKRTIGLLVERRVAQLGENWAMPALPHSSSVFLSALMPLAFDVLEIQTELLFIPYFSSSFDQLNHSSAHKLGFDLYYQPDSASQLALTVTPDFGQVENDEIVVNFSAFETFTPEKRGFFLENQEIFEPKGELMLNTRRIGARPDKPKLKTGEKIIHQEGYSEVLAAGKYTGQSGNMRYGVLSAIEEDGDYRLNDGTQGSVDGRKYLALRNVWQHQDNKGQFHSIGYLGSFTDHHFGLHHAHLIDGEFRSADQQWQLNSQLYLSDAGNKRGYGQRLEAIYTPKPGLKHRLVMRRYDRNLDLNDLGYLRRNNVSSFYYQLQTPEITDSVHYKSRKQLYWLSHRRNLDGQILQNRIFARLDWTFFDLTSLAIATNYTDSVWNDRKTRGHGAYRTNPYVNLWFRWQSDQSRTFSYGVSGWARRAQIQGVEASMEPFLTYAPTDRINIDASIDYRKDDNWLLWSGDADRINSFASKRVKTTLKTTWIIDDKQELRLALQWLGLRASARDRYRIGNDGKLQQSSQDTLQKSFARADLAVQIRYKYQFAPLSDLYLVYSRGGEAFGSDYDNPEGFGDLLSNSWTGTIADQLTLKARYRF